jgi:hypothetical protein
VQRRRRPAVDIPEGQRRTVRMVHGLPRRRRAVPAICARCGGSGIVQQPDVSAFIAPAGPVNVFNVQRHCTVAVPCHP